MRGRALLLALTLAACGEAEPPERITLPPGTPEKEVRAHCTDEAHAMAVWAQPNLQTNPDYDIAELENRYFDECMARHGLD